MTRAKRRARTLAASLALAATACLHRPTSPPHSELVYDPTTPRGQYIDAIVATGAYDRTSLEDAFALCDELASLEAAGLDVGALSEDDRARLWRRSLWSNIVEGTVQLPGGESSSQGILPAKSVVCAELSGRFFGGDPSTIRTAPQPYPVPPGPRADPDTASRIAEQACTDLPADADAA